jgi:lipopolysaccharide export system permease protein
MKKIDKLVLGSFIGPFILTFLVVVFILLTQHMLKYFDDIIGKDLGGEVLGQLLFYFAIFMIPVALPLAVLLSSLIAFGNLGEHFELTAIKSAGISLIRTLLPIFVFVLMLTVLAFYANNNLVPKAALEAYSLLYDIKQKKPALDLREGAFYNGITDISIKVDKKFPNDPAALKNITVYDHRKNDGNREVTKADSGRMTTILNERYLKFELFNGYNYTEGASDEREITGQKGGSEEALTRSKFSKTQVVFDLSSFKLERTDKKWFEGNRIMRNVTELEHDIDSIYYGVFEQRLNHYLYKPTYFNYLNKKEPITMPEEIEQFKLLKDSLDRARYFPNPDNQKDINAVRENVIRENKVPNLGRKRIAKEKVVADSSVAKTTLIDTTSRGKTSSDTTSSDTTSIFLAKKVLTKKDSLVLAKIDSIFNQAPPKDIIEGATNMARQVKSQVLNNNTNIENYEKELRVFQIQWHKILASSLACIAMFLIGAPLGAIIKKGGLGVPFLVSIFFFIVYYLLSMQGEKLSKAGTVSAPVGVWAADSILLFIGLIFLRQARVDARLFDADFYRIMADRFMQWFVRLKMKRTETKT